MRSVLGQRLYYPHRATQVAHRALRPRPADSPRRAKADVTPAERPSLACHFLRSPLRSRSAAVFAWGESGTLRMMSL